MLTCLVPQAPREIVMDSAHLLFQNSGGLSAPRVIEIWYLMGLNWGKQCLKEWEHLGPGPSSPGLTTDRGAWPLISTSKTGEISKLKLGINCTASLTPEIP